MRNCTADMAAVGRRANSTTHVRAAWDFHMRESHPEITCQVARGTCFEYRTANNAGRGPYPRRRRSCVRQRATHSPGGAAALAGSGSVRRRERPGLASLDCSRLAPLLAGPRRAAAARAVPCDDLCGPAECPTSLRSQCQRLLLQKQHLPLIRWRSGQARWTRAEQHDQNTPSPRCSAPRSDSKSRYTAVSSQFLADFKSNRLPDRNPGN
eukprot:COSAG04_NODE_1378_length_7010_cov_3.077268_3_plen_210_part_00